MDFSDAEQRETDNSHHAAHNKRECDSHCSYA